MMREPALPPWVPFHRSRLLLLGRWLALVTLLLFLAASGVACELRPPDLGIDSDDDDSADDDDDDDTTPPWEGDDDDGDDDDTGAGDDDDDTVPGDDDDDEVPGLTFDAISFSIPALEATPGPSGAVGFLATFQFTYWADAAGGIVDCIQEISIEGSGTFGSSVVPVGCDACTGSIEFAASTRNDISTPAVNPDHCDATELTEGNANWGDAMLLPITEGGFGDFLSMALMDSATMSSEDYDATVAGGATAPDLETAYGGNGFDFTHVGLVPADPGSMSQQSSLEVVASPAQAGSNWFGYWRVFRDPAVNGNDGADMNGTYRAESFWQINFN